MYINFWYPIVRSEDLGYDQPVKVRALGVDLVAFRDKAGDAIVLSDTCTHRGASLGGAWSQGASRPRIIDGCIVCPYHGWEFNGEGECVNLPSIGYGKKTPARAKVDSYPVQEKYGIVFAFLGDEPEETRIPLLDVEEYGQEGWVANEVLVLEVPYYYERSIENGIDPSHNEFVHPTHGHSSIDRDTYKVRDYEAEDHHQGWGFWFWSLFDTPPLPQKDHETAGGQDTPWGDTRTDDHIQMKVGGGTYGPNSMPTYINITSEKMFRQYFFELPVDENNTKIFFVNMRNFMLDPKNNGPIHARNKVIAAQDIQILDTMCPVRTPLSPTDEILTPSDNGVAAYRKWLEKFDDKGWRIDINKFNARHGKDKAYAIPCPSRHTSGNWVLDKIPTIKDRAERNRLNKDD
jgi:phenylpropionate dioxygenase-like ring-hydroxylating dioxygenase large terminal subunit